MSTKLSLETARGHWLSSDPMLPPAIHAALRNAYAGCSSASEFARVGKSSSKHSGESLKTEKKPTRNNTGPVKKHLGSSIKICCLGYFVIRRDSNISIGINRKTRPGVLLRLLLAGGPRGIDRQQAEKILWPSKVASSTRGSIDSTVYRLRQLLESDVACRIDRGRIVFDASMVSIDAWLFESEADSLLRRLRHADDAETGEIAVRVERLLELYRGPFLAADDSLPAIVRTRDRLQAKFARVIAAAGRYWQTVGRWDRATQLYEQGLASDNLSEETYRQIMRCHLAQGRFAEAVQAFDRCRDLLALVLGVTPSEETTALYRRALLGRDGHTEI